jgi:hypothetical protein
MLGSDLVDAARARDWSPSPAGFARNRHYARGRSGGEPSRPCDAVINCAAFTRVDDAEKERELCWRINADGAGNVARACTSARIAPHPPQHGLCFRWPQRIGTTTKTDPVAPLNYYGESKLGGRTAGADGGRGRGGGADPVPVRSARTQFHTRHPESDPARQDLAACGGGPGVFAHLYPASGRCLAAFAGRETTCRA